MSTPIKGKDVKFKPIIIKLPDGRALGQGDAQPVKVPATDSSFAKQWQAAVTGKPLSTVYETIMGAAQEVYRKTGRPATTVRLGAKAYEQLIEMYYKANNILPTGEVSAGGSISLYGPGGQLSVAVARTIDDDDVVVQ